MVFSWFTYNKLIYIVLHHYETTKEEPLFTTYRCIDNASGNKERWYDIITSKSFDAVYTANVLTT